MSENMPGMPIGPYPLNPHSRWLTANKYSEFEKFEILTRKISSFRVFPIKQTTGAIGDDWNKNIQSYT